METIEIGIATARSIITILEGVTVKGTEAARELLRMEDEINGQLKQVELKSQSVEKKG